MSKTLVIAEAGVNHNGSEEMAFALVDAAHSAGADVVKFQSFRAEKLASKSAEKANYQQQTTDSAESQLLMLKRLELSVDLHHRLKAYCDQRQIAFLSTPFDSDSLDFLVGELSMRCLKVPSGEITNAPLLLAFARSGCELIMSTGMASLAEVEDALGVLAWGMSAGPDSTPVADDFRRAWADPAARSLLKSRVSLLHCTSQYPAPLDEVNLNVLSTLATAFGLRVGYSDHTPGITIPIAATAMGAEIIEKHFTLDRCLEGPDHRASLEPDELKAMVEGIRTVERARGDGVKTLQPSEANTLTVARKSLVALRPIAAGDVFTESNLGVKRPAGGKSPFDYWRILGNKAERDYDTDEAIE